MKHPLLVFILLLLTFKAKGQPNRVHDSTTYKKVRNIVPRLGIGMSRHFLTEVGIAYMRSNFIDHKDFGLNTANFIYYLSFETMTPYTQPIRYAVKSGVEMINIGHVTSAGGFEMAYYKRDTLTSGALILKVGFPIVNGSLSYGFAMYTEAAMRKEVGRHRITLSYCFNRKSDRALQSMFRKKP
jgi:hypothetical protein